MRWITILDRRCRALLRRGVAERGLEAELSFHRERQIAANLAEGMPLAEARRQAALDFGGVEGFTEAAREARGLAWVHDLVPDLRFGLRLLRRSPGFSAFAVLTLALGIGINVALFTVLCAAALRPLPVPKAERLVTVAQHLASTPGADFSRNVHDDPTFVSWLEYRRYAAENRSLGGLAAYSPFVDTTLDNRAPILGTMTSCNYFAVLGIRPALGRFFAPDECATAGAGAVAVLSDAVWRREFAGERGVLGRTIVLNRTPFTVIGVAPPGFAGTVPVASGFWAPLTMQRAFSPNFNFIGDPNQSWLALLGRLKPGVSMARAAADLNVVAARMNALQPGRRTSVALAGATYLAMPSLRSAVSSASVLILAAVALVLLLACANLAGFLLARAEGRRKEVAVRLALGARRGRLIRQLLTESVLIAALGGFAGALAASFATPALFHLAMSHLPIAPEFHFTLRLAPDWRTWLYAFAIALLTAIAFGLAPALRATRTELTEAMKSGAAPGQTAALRAKPGAGRWQRRLVGAQVAACMILLLAAGLLLRGLGRVLRADPGFQLANVAAVKYDLAGAGYTPARAQAFQQQLASRVAALPGVSAVAQATLLPLGGSHDLTGVRTATGAPSHPVEYNSVSPSFFPLLGIAIQHGRNFTTVEAESGAHVLILARSTAQRIWPGQDAVGKTLDGWGAEWRVVGIAADAQVAGLGSTTSYIYRPAGPDPAADLKMLVRSRGASATLPQEVAATARALDPSLPLTAAPLAANLAATEALAKVVSALAAVLGGLALLLAVIGIYGMVAYAASLRGREIGIRMALGAGRGEVLALVVRQALAPVLWGAALGMAGFAAVALALTGVLYGVSPWDPVAFTAMPLLLLSVALLASYLPARRALAGDPVAVLRCD